MEVYLQAITAMRAVTVSREYGSGGGEIAARLARKLGWQLIDHAVIEQAASELGIYETEMEKHDEEYIESTLSRILNRIQNFASKPFIAGSSGAPSGFAPPPPTVDTPAYQGTIRQLVIAAANAGHAVIVGRGGQVLLADRRDVLHVRVVAPLDLRVAYVARREGLDRDAARKRVEAKDRARDRNSQSQFHQKPDDPHLYDLVISTAVLDLDSAINLIGIALESKASRLSVPAEELGPAAGLVAYAGRPADFHVPGRSTL